MEFKKLSASHRRILITQWADEVATKIDSENGVEYRRRVFEKSDLSITADGSHNNLINLEGMDREFGRGQHAGAVGGCTAGLTCSCQRRTPAGLKRREEKSDATVGENTGGANDELVTIDVDDNSDEGEEPLPFKIPTR